MWGGLSSNGDIFADTGDECLVTDITHELSVGWENANSLAESVSLFEHDGKNGYIHCKTFNCDVINECVKEDSTLDLSVDDDGSPFLKTDNSSGSGSETSSVEHHWHVKNELYTPPTTPPDGSGSPESVCIIASHPFLPLSAPCVNSVSDRSKPRLKTIIAKEGQLRFTNGYPSNCVVIEDDATQQPETQRPLLSKEELQRQQAKRRQERMIRNRESAYLSRKRKKEHVAMLEKQVNALTALNQKLKLENEELRERLCKYEPWPIKHSWRRLPDLPRKTTAFLALVVTVCINIGSLSGVLDSGQLRSGGLQLDPSPTNHHTRSLLWAEHIDDQVLSNLTRSCPVAINQSESRRLERELRRWIVGEKEMVDLRQPPRRPRDDSSKLNAGVRKKRLPRARKIGPAPSSLDLFNIKAHLLGMDSLYEAIHRRADTFYLVSFSADHLLLPAISQNQTTRPKMSVMLPAILANGSSVGSEPVEMMQIDCEVTNTQLLSVRGNDIPYHMRGRPKYFNSSVKAGDSADPATFQRYPLTEHPANFVIDLNRRVSLGGNVFNRTKAIFSTLPANDEPKNVSLPDLVTPYLNGTIDLFRKNSTFVMKSQVGEAVNRNQSITSSLSQSGSNFAALESIQNVASLKPAGNLSSEDRDDKYNYRLYTKAVKRKDLKLRKIHELLDDNQSFSNEGISVVKEEPLSPFEENTSNEVNPSYQENIVEVKVEQPPTEEYSEKFVSGYPWNLVVIGAQQQETQRHLLSKEKRKRLEAKRKQERMLKNRESAYLSRKRKKEHVAMLEKQVNDLTALNQNLKLENKELRERLRKYETGMEKAT